MKNTLLSFLALMIASFTVPALSQEIPSMDMPSMDMPGMDMSGAEAEKAAIQAQATAFSKAYVAGDIESIMQLYTEDARIVPINGRIISRRDVIRQFWTAAISGTAKVLSHKTETEDLIVSGDIATDIGYYTGESRLSDGKKNPFGGAYIIVWKKVSGVWRMQLDMWNTVRDLNKK